jgi:DNA-binding transcriptional LysR family regulator
MPRTLTQHSLQAFRLTILAGGVSAAAEALGRSQPAVSRLLKELEQDVGFRLFDRVKGRLHPTGEGSLLFQEVQRAFIGLDRIASIAGEIRTGRRGTIAVGSMPAVAASVIPGVLRRMTEQRPGTSVLLHTLPSATLVQMVLTQECDIAVVIPDAVTPGVRVERHDSFPCRLITPPGHRLLKRACVRPADLASEALVMLSSGTHIGRQVGAMLEQHGIDKLTRIETHLSPLVSALVLQGAGIGFVDSINAEHHVRQGGGAVPFEPAVTFELEVVRREQAEMTPAQALFLETYEQEITAARGAEAGI